MMELLIKAVCAGCIDRFQINFCHSYMKNGLSLSIYLSCKSGKNQTTYKSLNELMKEAEELDVVSLEIALSQYVTKLLKEFKEIKE